MKRILTYISVGVISASSMLCPIIARAQTTTALETSQGILGKRYAGLSFGVADPKYTSDNIYGVSAGVHVPVTSFLDIGGGYAYSRYKTEYPQYYATKNDSHSISSDFVFYKKIVGGLKPFISAGLGYSWYTTKVESRSIYVIDGKMKDDFATWGTSIGIEIPFSWVALTPVIGYSGNFENERSQAWSYGLQASSWITRKVGLYAGVSYSEPKHNFGDSHTWSYTTGLRIKF